MTISRRAQISLQDTPYYHCIARCVRRAFLCGHDDYSGQNFSHRRQWLLDRLKQQAAIFSIDICAYAIMSNHYHLVLRVDQDRASRYSDDEIMNLWCRLFRGPVLVQRYLAGVSMSDAEQETIKDIAGVWRERLTSISWFMRCINEFIARQANAEDQCKGRFWEGRFRSQALLDDAAVLSCMAYVDLNPVRAGISADLLDSDFTSIQQRLRLATSKDCHGNQKADGYVTLMAFAKPESNEHAKPLLPFTLKDYIDLVDWTGKVIRDDKPTHIKQQPFVLGQLGLNKSQWLELSLDIQKASLRAIGNMAKLEQYNRSQGKQWLCGQRNLAKLYATA
jgi:putative transposase